jgi:Anthrone oxygenase
MTELITLVAVLACTFFTGAAVYINFVEHPARLSCGTAIAALQWAPSYKRATVMQASLAAVAAMGGVACWAQTANTLWLWGAVLIVAVVPFTLVVIRPTNTRLLQPGRDLKSAETRRLLERWGHLHAVRSAFGMVASVLYVRAASGG